jgi:hypothetical protein
MFVIAAFNNIARISTYTVEPGYNDIGLHDTSSIALDTLWYQLITPR